MIFLSYILNSATPTYGNRNSFKIEKRSDIAKGNIANDSFISTTVHIGTHIDMPYHFYGNGQTIENYDAGFWIFDDPLFVEIEPENLIIKEELVNKIKNLKKSPDFNQSDTRLLIVKTGICHKRDTREFWEKNYGFHPSLYDFLTAEFPHLQVIGFDSISISSFQERLTGREAHKTFLNPEKPVLILEDMNLCDVDEKTRFEKVIVAPLRIAGADGLPCTVFGVPND